LTFGIASYTVAQRTNEIGIRMTLGAGQWSVIRDALRGTMRVFGIGLVLGVVAAIAAVRWTTGPNCRSAVRDHGHRHGQYRDGRTGDGDRCVDGPRAGAPRYADRSADGDSV
jgi:hypothetical protein